MFVEYDCMFSSLSSYEPAYTKNVCLCVCVCVCVCMYVNTVCFLCAGLLERYEFFYECVQERIKA
jgi:hypothetical protein